MTDKTAAAMFGFFAIVFLIVIVAFDSVAFAPAFGLCSLNVGYLAGRAAKARGES